MSRFVLGPKIGTHVKLKPDPAIPFPVAIAMPTGPVDQLADFEGISSSSSSPSDDAVFSIRPLGATDVPLVAIHVVVAPIPDGGVSPIPADALAAALMDPALFHLRGEYRVPAVGEPPTPVRVAVLSVPFGSTDWRTVFEYAS